MNKTKIDWCDSTWNPVTGCFNDCEYCYARRIAERFGGEQKYANIFKEDEPVIGADGRALAYPHSFSPTFFKYRLNDYKNKHGRNIFVCSMADLFGDWVPDSWIEEVFDACDKAPQHNYLFLTKNPKRYGKVIKDNYKDFVIDHISNFWFGTSVTDGKSLVRFANCYSKMNFKTKLFLSIEPILTDISKTAIWNECVELYNIGWVIIGAETGHRKGKVVPKREWIERITHDCYVNNIPVFMKSSLAEIWGELLIQEFPDGLRKTSNGG